MEDSRRLATAAATKGSQDFLAVRNEQRFGAAKRGPTSSVDDGDAG